MKGACLSKGLEAGEEPSYHFSNVAIQPLLSLQGICNGHALFFKQIYLYTILKSEEAVQTFAP